VTLPASSRYSAAFVSSDVFAACAAGSTGGSGQGRRGRQLLDLHEPLLESGRLRRPPSSGDGSSTPSTLRSAAIGVLLFVVEVLDGIDLGELGQQALAHLELADDAPRARPSGTAPSRTSVSAVFCASVASSAPAVFTDVGSSVRFMALPFVVAAAALLTASS
jgi:hypothetical protein